MGNERRRVSAIGVTPSFCSLVVIFGGHWGGTPSFCSSAHTRCAVSTRSASLGRSAGVFRIASARSLRGRTLFKNGTTRGFPLTCNRQRPPSRDDRSCPRRQPLDRENRASYRIVGRRNFLARRLLAGSVAAGPGAPPCTADGRMAAASNRGRGRGCRGGAASYSSYGIGRDSPQPLLLTYHLMES